MNSLSMIEVVAVNGEAEQVISKVIENRKEIETVDTPIAIKKWRIWKDLLVICLAWVLLFTAFQGMASLQSSLNMQGDVGMNSMAIIYAFLIFSSVLLPHPLTMVICQFGYLAFIAANLYPEPALMYPASVLLGLAGAPLWTSEDTYITQLGILNAELKGKQCERGVTQFFGIFFAFFQTSQIWGNLISYSVLRSTSEPAMNNTTPSNEVIEKSIVENLTNLTNHAYQYASRCTEKDFHVTSNSPVPMKLVFTLCYIYIGLAIASIVLVTFLLDHRRKKEESESTIKTSLKNSIRHFTSTLKRLRYPYQILLIPFTLWSGLSQTYISAQFTKRFITCAVGVEYVGLIMIVYGVCDALISFSCGQIAKHIGRIYCLLIAALINYTLIVTMLIWIPTEHQLWLLFLPGGFWGIADGCWQTQISASYGVLFTEHESTFSNFRLWESLGFVIAYVYTPRMRIHYAQIILLCVLTLSMICYTIIDIRERRRKRKLEEDKPSSPTIHQIDQA